MCIMEIHSRQQTATMVQAVAHNSSTIDRDLDMLIEVMKRRGGVLLDPITQAQDHIHHAYAILLDAYGEAVAVEVADPDGHVHDHDHGHERSFVEQAHHDAALARQFETR